MITVKRFKDILGSCPDDWRLEFRKWEHMSSTPDGLNHGYKGMPNFIGVKIQDSFERYDDISGNKIRTIVFVDEYDDVLEGSQEYLLDAIAKDLNDEDYLNFVLEVEDYPGKIDHISLDIEAGDKGYLDKFMIIDLEEKFNFNEK